jgi:AcrR family transcriptional regulator
LAGQSLRDIAAAVGTSHRMLVYHFGSREGLLSAVVEEVERQEQARSADVGAADPERALEAIWAAVSSPDRADEERLFYELMAGAMRGAPGTEALAARSVDPWLEVGSELAEQLGADPQAARDLTRLDIAVVRGLLHDLLVTGDREEVERAFRLFARWQREALAAVPSSMSGEVPGSSAIADMNDV